MNESDLDQTDRRKQEREASVSKCKRHVKASDAKAFPKREQNNEDTFQTLNKQHSMFFRECNPTMFFRGHFDLYAPIKSCDFSCPAGNQVICVI